MSGDAREEDIERWRKRGEREAKKKKVQYIDSRAMLTVFP